MFRRMFNSVRNCRAELIRRLFLIEESDIIKFCPFDLILLECCALYSIASDLLYDVVTFCENVFSPIEWMPPYCYVIK